MITFSLVLGSALLAITCPKGEVEVDGQCYPESCVFEDVVCNGHGMCVHGSCSCDNNYSFGDQGCYPERCYMGESAVCSGHGKCIENEPGIFECVCNKHYMNQYGICVPEACYTEDGLCSNSGSCIQPTDGSEPHCKCRPTNAGEKCEKCSDEAVFDGEECIHKNCLSELIPGQILVCNGMGRCMPSLSPSGIQYDCTCYPYDAKAYNGTCVANTCVTKAVGDNILEVCSEHGICVEQKCICDSEHNGLSCEYDIVDCKPGFTSAGGKCYPTECVKDGIICSNLGHCVWDGSDAACVCGEGYVFYENECVYAACLVNGVLCPYGTYDTSRSVPTCKCAFDHIKYKNVCYPASCVTAQSKYSPPQLCNDAGACDFETGVCSCFATNTGKLCEDCAVGSVRIGSTCRPWSCVDDTDPDNMTVCSGRGQCVERSTGNDMNDVCYYCACELGYKSVNAGQCVSVNCITNKGLLCNNHGQCVGDHCECDEGYSGTSCAMLHCPDGQTAVNNACVPDECVTRYGDSSNTFSVCGGYGKCVEEHKKHKCKCRADAVVVDGECTSPACITDASSNQVCNGHGKCNNMKCVCIRGYRGKMCDKEIA